MNREFLMLAQTFKGQYVKGWLVSEKLDGMRAFWDGGISRGVCTDDIPWANTSQREIATGLWSRYGHPIHAPSWWLDMLPSEPLDGELWTNRGEFQTIVSIVRRDIGDGRWSQVRYKVFDSPNLDLVFTTGRINNPNFKITIQREACIKFAESHGWVQKSRVAAFHAVYKRLCDDLHENDVVLLHRQEVLSNDGHMDKILSHVMSLGGEGLMLRDPRSVWFPKRGSTLLKVKRLQDAEGLVVGYRWGEGKLNGLMGSLVVQFKGKQFDLSGFTDEERKLSAGTGEPGEPVRPDIENRRFPRGSQVTFTYRELTDDGIPKEARFLRTP